MVQRATTPLAEGPAWTFGDLQTYMDVIGEIAETEFNLDIYPNQIEIVSAEQMLDAYAFTGLPVCYNHWRYGKYFQSWYTAYNKGQQGLAYELVINCLKEDTSVFTRSGIKPISNAMIGEEVWNGQTFSEIIAKKIQHVEDAIRITLSNGRVLVCTPEHRFLVYNAEKKVIKTARELAPNEDFFITPLRCFDGGIELDLTSFNYVPPVSGFGEKFLYAPYCSLPPMMTDQLAELMGIIMGDGHINHESTGAFTILVGWDNEEYISHVFDLIKNVFDVTPTLRKQESVVYPGEYHTLIQVLSTEIKMFLDFCGLKRNFTHKTKRIPISVMSGTPRIRGAFLRGIFDTDGCVKKNGDKPTGISYSCYNEDLGQDISLLLSSLGIPSIVKRRKNGKNKISEITLPVVARGPFLRYVGSKSKKADALRVLVSQESKYQNDNSNISHLPSFYLDKYKTNRRRIPFLRNVECDGEDREEIENNVFTKVVSVELLQEPTTVVDISLNSKDKLFVADGVMSHNSNPAISYLMEENNLVTQALVMAHACYGHNAFFKNNFLFKEWTHADAILDYMIFARDFIKECEDKYGMDKVEETLDACHSIEHHGVDKYRRPPKLSAADEKARKDLRREEKYKEVWEFWKTLPGADEVTTTKEEEKIFPKEPEENLLYFMEKYSPVLEDWQREIVRIVRKIQQYFYPQSQTKIGNEGYASFWHYEIIYRMFELGYVTDGFMQSFLALHTAVVNQPNYNSGCCGIVGLNPYYVGFHTFQEIKRICNEPTKEDQKWFPELVGKPWIEEVQKAAYEYKDESFILQYLSPALIRKMRLFMIHDSSGQPHYEVKAISDDDGYRSIRSKLSRIYNRAYQVPDVQVVKANMKGDRKLTLKHFSVDNMPLLEKDKIKVMAHLKYLWGFDVELVSDASPKRPFSEEDYYVWI